MDDANTTRRELTDAMREVGNSLRQAGTGRHIALDFDLDFDVLSANARALKRGGLPADEAFVKGLMVGMFILRERASKRGELRN